MGRNGGEEQGKRCGAIIWQVLRTVFKGKKEVNEEIRSCLKIFKKSKVIKKELILTTSVNKMGYVITTYPTINIRLSCYIHLMN